jgi:hypothetical protein
MRSRWALLPAAGPAVVLLTLLCFATVPSHASVVTFALGREYTGGTSPAGTGPWVTAAFDDHGTSGLVTLTVRADLLDDSEFVSRVAFNLDPAINPAALAFSSPQKVGTFTDPDVLLGVNDVSAGGGRFDLGLAFATGKPAGRFGAADVVTYTVTGVPGLTAGSFWLPSAGSGVGGDLLASAHVQGIGPGANESGWVSVPEPASASLLVIGALTFLRRLGRPPIR